MNLNNNSAIGEDATNFVDISEYGNDGSCSGATCPVYSSSGKFGGAYVFNGSSDYIDCGNAASLNITAAITIEAWAKISGGSSNYPRIVSKRSQGPYELLINLTSGGVQLALNDASTHYCNGSTNVSDGEWHHLAGTWNGSVMHVYVDGELDDTVAASFSGTLLTNNYNAWIGAQGNGPGDYLDGTVDEVRVYNRALSADEIGMHYQSEIQKYNSTTWRFYDNVTNLTTAQYLYYGWAEDTAGLTGQTETRTLNVANAPSITLNLPENCSLTNLNWVILNATVTDADDDDMTVHFYANNDSNGLNVSDGLVYIAENVANGSTVTYNLTALPVKPSEDDLVLLMHFDNRAAFGENTTHVYDFSGNGNNGTTSGDPIMNLSGGKFAGAYAFDGTDDYVEAPAISQISGSNSRTVEFWFKTTYNSGNQPIFDGGAINQIDTAFEFFTTAQDQIGNSPPMNTPGLYYGFWDNDVYLPDINYYDGNWHHVALTLYSNNITELYYDGTKPQGVVWGGSAWTSLTSQPFSLPRNPDTPGDQPFLIGKSRARCWSNGNMHFNGTIDEVAIHNRSLSADEILNHYRLAKGKYYWQVNASDGAFSNESEIWEFSVGIQPDLRVVNVTFEDWDTATNKSAVSETGTDCHVKEGRNISINATIANYGLVNVSSNFNVSFFDSAGVYGDWNTWVWNFTYNVTAEGELGSTTTGYPYNTTYATGYWNPSLIGTHNISVWADPDNSADESTTTNNNGSAVINVSAWQKYWGNVSGNIVLADSAGHSMINWVWSNVTGTGNIYIVDEDVSVNWSALHGLGCNIDNTLNASGNDFSEADTAFNMKSSDNNATGFVNNNITELFCDGNPNTAINTTYFVVWQRNVTNVPVVNSSDMTNHVVTSNFYSGILWDQDSGSGTDYYDGTQDLVVVANERTHALGFADVSAVHNYEVGLPCSLNATSGGNVDFYVELAG